jgi:cytochrome P450
MLEDMDLGGVTVPKGHYVLAVLASGNHDPEAFEDPDRLDLGRDENRHLGFGFGVHHCLGAPLARLETAIAVPRFLERVGSIEVTADTLSYRENAVLRGLVELPVRISAA